MRVLLLLVLVPPAFARTALERLEAPHLEAVHAQRVEWMKKRIAAPLPGIYQDFRSVGVPQAEDPQVILDAAKADDVRVILVPGGPGKLREGVLLMAPPSGLKLPEFEDPEPRIEINTPKQRRTVENRFKQYPDEVFAVTGSAFFAAYRDLHWPVALRNTSTHILARELTEAEVRDSVVKGRTYAAHDWLCDPAGFYFIAENNLGVFDMGDNVPMLNNTRLQARFPVPAIIRLSRDGKIISEVTGPTLSFAVKEQGAYRLEASLTVDGEERPWISSNSIYIGKPPSLDLPTGAISEDVEVRKDIVYTDGDAAEAGKHRMDLYLPKGKKNFPVMVFLHGGFWRMGDRSLYPLFGNRFAKAGIGVAIPSYRLMPKNPHPAQIADAAAAFAWVYRNIAEYGGDVTRLYVAGHSAGGHLAALLALDRDYLTKYEIPQDAIHGVASLSGVYDVGALPAFQAADDDPSPIHHIHTRAPPFLLTYCQWDYLQLPKQARDFAVALKREFVGVQLQYIPGESHISEIIDTLKDGDLTAQALLNFIK